METSALSFESLTPNYPAIFRQKSEPTPEKSSGQAPA